MIKKKILLGSQSPRRRELLSDLGYDFEVVSIDCEENYPENLAVEKVAGFLSELKAKAFRELSEDEVLITADTIVAMGDEVLGKPKNAEKAKEMLRKLSGKTHQVYTSISVKTAEKIITEIDVADVEFLPLDEEEIDYYVEKFSPMDKAGAYGIQEWLGMAKISKINGSFYTIMGLPTAIIYKILRNFV